MWSKIKSFFETVWALISFFFMMLFEMPFFTLGLLSPVLLIAAVILFFCEATTWAAVLGGLAVVGIVGILWEIFM